MKITSKKLLAGVLAGAMIVSAASGCQKSDGASADKKGEAKFPTKAITLVVPVEAGGSSDAIARLMSNYSDKYFGKPMVIVNQPGGASTLATAETAKAKPDGYTVVFSPVGAVCVQPHYGQIQYTYSDLKPVAQVSEEAIVLVTKKGKYKDLKDLIQQGKDAPGSIKHANSSIGGPVHLVMEKLFNDAGVKAEAIGYKGNSEVKAALLGGHINAGVLHPSEVLPILKGGEIDALAVSTSTGKRDPALPDVPTFQELGYDIDFTVWKGIFAPKDIPENVSTTLNKGFEGILNDADFQKEMQKIGQGVAFMSPDEFSKKIEKEYNYYGEVIEKTGMKEKVTGK